MTVSGAVRLLRTGRVSGPLSPAGALGLNCDGPGRAPRGQDSEQCANVLGRRSPQTREFARPQREWATRKVAVNLRRKAPIESNR